MPVQFVLSPLDQSRGCGLGNPPPKYASEHQQVMVTTPLNHTYQLMFASFLDPLTVVYVLLLDAFRNYKWEGHVIIT